MPNYTTTFDDGRPTEGAFPIHGPVQNGDIITVDQDEYRLSRRWGPNAGEITLDATRLSPRDDKTEIEPDILELDLLELVSIIQNQAHAKGGAAAARTITGVFLAQATACFVNHDNDNAHSNRNAADMARLHLDQAVSDCEAVAERANSALACIAKLARGKNRALLAQLARASTKVVARE